MKALYLKHIFSFLLSTMFFTTLLAQNNQNLWTKISSQTAIAEKQSIKKTESIEASYYQLDVNQLKTLLNNAPKRSTDHKKPDVIVPFPNNKGDFDSFRIKEASILEPSFQLKHPELRSYVGQNINNPSNIIRFSITSKGLHTIEFFSNNGTQFIEPLDDSNSYIVYQKQNISNLEKEFVCHFNESDIELKKTNTSAKLFNANDGMLRTFRLAISSTIEYSAFHWMAAGLTAGDTEAAKKEKVLEAMVVTMTRVNAIYERDLSITMTMVDNSNIIFIDSDSFNNDNAQVLIGQSQSEIDGTIGEANYDIGHTFSTGAGGFASPGVCVSGVKARGVTGTPSPVGATFDIDIVAHEIGHQFGAPHTFNGDADNCGGVNRFASNAYEPGSGSTIMAYAGICTPQNIQTNTDAYFHQKSLQMIWDSISTGDSNCGVETPTGNAAPVADAGSNYTIPISTPYKLTGNSTDADGTGSHTYTWEQYDLGDAGIPEETNTSGPLVRSFEGTNNPIRNIPNISDYLVTGGSTAWEKLASVNRTLNFALTVRDNDLNGGQTAVDFMQITVDSTDPFMVTNPVSWAQGSNQTVEWVVGQTANPSTINCQFVNIKLSTDGGLTYPIDLALNTPNDGSESITVPAISDISTARIIVEAADNIFYDISDFDFSISTAPDFFIVNASLDPLGCGSTTASFNFDYVVVNGFSETTTFSASGNPAGSSVVFVPENLNISGNVAMTVSNINLSNQGSFPITISGTSSPSNIVKNTNIDLSVFSDLCTSFGNTQDQTGTTLVQFNTINNASPTKPPSGGYSNYTSVSTEVNRNSLYNLTINVNTDGNFIVATKVWIDWNQNCIFDIPDEEYDLGGATNTNGGATSNSALPITIPADAALGNIIMRVSTKYDEAPTSCEQGYFGEVEDYTLVVNPTLDVNEVDFKDFLVVFPNPNKGSFAVKLSGSSGPSIDVSVFDIRGRNVYQNNFINRGSFNEEILLNNVQNGIYILKVSDGVKTSTKKITIQ